MTIDLEQALKYKLINTAGILALIGTRCHPLRLPDEATLPALVYTEISAPIEATHDESAGASLAHPRYQVDAWATSYIGAVALGRQVHLALQGYKGVITSGADTFTVMGCLRLDKRSNNDPETGLFWISQDYEIWAIE